MSNKGGSNSTNNSGRTIAEASNSGVLRSSKINKSLQKPPYDGKLDKFGDVRIRIGIVDNPLIQRKNENKIDEKDPFNVVNMVTGKVSIRWMEQKGGVLRPPEFGEYGLEGELSDRESVTLNHPIMWANDINWFGINYLPPVGSVVLAGFRKHGIPVLLGFIQSHYEVVYPLELGEIMNKGYGQNTSHWKMNDEQEHKAWVIQDQELPVEHIETEPGRKYRYEKTPYTVGLKLRLKAWKDPFNPSEKEDIIPANPNRPVRAENPSKTIDLSHTDDIAKKEMIEMYAYRIKDGVLKDHSMVEVRPERIHMWSENPEDKKMRTEQIMTPEFSVNRAEKLQGVIGEESEEILYRTEKIVTPEYSFDRSVDFIEENQSYILLENGKINIHGDLEVIVSTSENGKVDVGEFEEFESSPFEGDIPTSDFE